VRNVVKCEKYTSVRFPNFESFSTDLETEFRNKENLETVQTSSMLHTVTTKHCSLTYFEMFFNAVVMNLLCREFFHNFFHYAIGSLTI
jgi:hypothetical protein